MKKSERLKIFLILRIIKAKSNIGLNELARIKTGNGIMLLDLIIFQKLSRIFIFVILINCNFKQELESEKGIYLFKRSYIKIRG